jgi:molybdopterin converting factor small subunit
MVDSDKLRVSITRDAGAIVVTFVGDLDVFVADEDIRFLQNLDTPLTDGQVVSIVPAVAGGA